MIGVSLYHANKNSFPSPAAELQVKPGPFTDISIGKFTDKVSIMQYVSNWTGLSAAGLRNEFLFAWYKLTLQVIICSTRALDIFLAIV